METRGSDDDDDDDGDGDGDGCEAGRQASGGRWRAHQDHTHTGRLSITISIVCCGCAAAVVSSVQMRKVCREVWVLPCVCCAQQNEAKQNKTKAKEIEPLSVLSLSWQVRASEFYFAYRPQCPQ